MQKMRDINQQIDSNAKKVNKKKKSAEHRWWCSVSYCGFSAIGTPQPSFENMSLYIYITDYWEKGQNMSYMEKALFWKN